MFIQTTRICVWLVVLKQYIDIIIIILFDTHQQKYRLQTEMITVESGAYRPINYNNPIYRMTPPPQIQ